MRRFLFLGLRHVVPASTPVPCVSSAWDTRLQDLCWPTAWPPFLEFLFKWATPPFLHLIFLFTFFSFCFIFPTYCHHLKWSCSCIYLFIIRFYPNKMLIPWEQRSRCLVSCWMPRAGIEDSQETLVQWTDGFCREKIPTGFLRGGQLYRGKMYGLCPQGLCQEGKGTQGLRMFPGIWLVSKIC